MSFSWCSMPPDDFVFRRRRGSIGIFGTTCYGSNSFPIETARCRSPNRESDLVANHNAFLHPARFRSLDYCHLQKHRRQAKFSDENSGFGLFDRWCELSKIGRTVYFYPVAAHDFYFHASTRITQQFSRSESGGHEPDHQSTQSAPVPTQCHRRASTCFRAALRVPASKDYHQPREVERRARTHFENCGTLDSNRKLLTKMVSRLGIIASFQSHAVLVGWLPSNRSREDSLLERVAAGFPDLAILHRCTHNDRKRDLWSFLGWLTVTRRQDILDQEVKKLPIVKGDRRQWWNAELGSRDIVASDHCD
jgi:hypothetical protein